MKTSSYEVTNVTCDNEVQAEWNSEEWSLKIIANPNHVNRIKCSVDFEVTLSNYIMAKSEYDASVVKEEHEATDQTGTNAQTDYRFVGANPNNYVCLEADGICEDDELYRIVGVIPTQSSAEGAYENRVKLIQNTMIVGYPWSGSSENTSAYWTKSTLNTDVLNGTYWDEIESYHKYIEPAKWYLNSAYMTGPFINLYSTERSGVHNTIANVGLVYASDIGFATGAIGEKRQACLIAGGMTWINELAYCSEAHWLIDYIVTLTSNYSAGYVIFGQRVSTQGTSGGLNSVKPNTPGSVHPSFYLKSTVKYLSGSGTQNDPYKVTIE